jgi:hypothetical protein
MKHLEIIANCTGDGISAISSCQKLAKAYGENIILNFKDGFNIMVRPNSDEQDLIQIWMLNNQLRKKT